MGYIGPSPNPGQNREVDDISSGFNGGTASFTLQVNGQNVSPGSANAIIVSLGGVVQNPGTDYTIAATFKLASKIIIKEKIKLQICIP